MILLLEEYNTKHSSHPNMKFHVNKLWEAIKLKYIYNMSTSQLNRVHYLFIILVINKLTYFYSRIAH